MKNKIISLLIVLIGFVFYSGQVFAQMAHSMSHDMNSQPEKSSTVSQKNDPAVISHFEKKGVHVEFSVTPESEMGSLSSTIREADLAEVAFRITDAATGAPISPLEPAVWINLEKDSAEAQDLSCKDKISLYLQGTLGFQADMDLNKFYMLVMNNDHTISVIDPILGVNGITQLYGMVVLKERGEDWVIGSENKYLYVSMPRSGLVGVVDLETFKVVKNIKAGKNPTRIALQPDGRYLWVANSGDAPEEEGVSVIDTHNREPVAFIQTGAGHHEIAFSDDSLTAYVSNSKSGDLSIIDSQRLKKIKNLAVGERPVSVAYSTMSQSIYVANEGDGMITVIDGASHQLTQQLKTEPGLISLRFAPGQRWGFAVNLKKDLVHVLDASSNTLSHRFAVGSQPHQVTFTENYAYIRNLGSPDVQLIPLAQLSQQQEFKLQTIPLGNRSPNEYPYLATADAISATGEWDTVLISSPADKTVYYYMEGMVAPMGTFPTYGRVPRAVQVVDRSLRETDKGVYSTKLRVPKSGRYEVAFLIDSPWVYNCFDFTAEVNPVMTAAREKAPPRLEILNNDRTLVVGQEYKLRFTLSQNGKEGLLDGLDDVSVLTSRPPGNWQNRQHARPLEDGRYEVPLTVDRPGVYYVYFAVPSLKVGFARLPYIVLTASGKSGG